MARLVLYSAAVGTMGGGGMRIDGRPLLVW